MQWLIALETNSDPITSCRLINIFRRKSVGIVTLAMAARPQGFSVITVAETAEADVEHIYNFLRRVEGVQHVTYYRHEPRGDASFVFIDSEPKSQTLTRVLQDFPGARMIFGSEGKYLLEVPGGQAVEGSPAEILPFVRVKSSVPQPDLITAQAS
jgi:hypothetical protein